MFLFGRKGRCRRVRGMFSEYLDNRLGDEDRDIVERHVESCGACSEELESLRMTVDLLHRVPEARVPRPFALREAEMEKGGVLEPRATGVLRPAAAFAAAVLEPQSMRWLRPATAIAVIALVMVLMLDFLQVVPQGGEPVVMEPDRPAWTLSDRDGGGNEDELKFEGNESLYLGAGEVPPPGSEEKSPAVPQPAEEGFHALSGAEDYDGQVSGEADTGWPMLQVEIAVGVVAFILLAVTVYVGWLRRRWRDA